MTTRSKSTVRLGVEKLEAREVFAVANVALLPNGWLRVDGTQGSDVLVVRQNQNQLEVDGWRGSYNAAQVQGVILNGLGSDDVLVNQTALMGIIFGGAGDDFIVGGGAADYLWGDGGNDFIFGRNGNDVIYGGDNEDVLSGGNGFDQVYGGGGADVTDGTCDWTPDANPWWDTRYGHAMTLQQGIDGYRKLRRGGGTLNQSFTADFYHSMLSYTQFPGTNG